MQTLQKPSTHSPTLQPGASSSAALGRANAEVGAWARLATGRAGLKWAIDVERLLWWTYGDQAVTGRALASGLMSEGGGAAVESAKASGAVGYHPDALLVQTLVSGLPSQETELVVQHALSQSRPDWCRDHPLATVKPILNLRRAPSIIYDNRHPVMCEVRCTDWSEWIEGKRATYRRWQSSLKLIAYALGARHADLTRWFVTGPVAPAKPWEQRGT